VGVIDVSLSFDNGPDPEVTPRVLDVLAARGLRATFFVVGVRLVRPEGRALAARAHAEGHWIGNHTFTHARPLGELDDAHARQEIEATQAVIGDLAHPGRLFRPMGGGGHLDRRLLNEAAVETLIDGRYTCVVWNAVPRDWEQPDGWVERALEQCRTTERPVLVLHDRPTGAMDDLERFLDLAEETGLRFVQEFPDACLPIRRGEPAPGLDALVTPRPAG
jgi:peptidoglycan/xylan/chitin deacetylase (PgdA/CDA1 family)